jgi:hypothetical protein
MILPKSLKEAKINKNNLTNEEIYCIIQKFIQDQVDLVRRKQESDESFESPAWSERQAYSLGLIKGLDKVLKFIPLTKGSENV